MNRLLNTLKETMQYAGIVTLSLLSAFWLLLRGKGNTHSKKDS